MVYTWERFSMAQEVLMMGDEEAKGLVQVHGGDDGA
jgi:hypothetical protein